MPRRSRNQITKELALAIVDKLGAENHGGSSHDQYVVYDDDDEAVALFSIRRGSQKNKGHDYIPGEIGVGPNFAKQLARCTKSRNDYLKKLGFSVK